MYGNIYIVGQQGLESNCSMAFYSIKDNQSLI